LKSIGTERFDVMIKDEYGDWIDSLTFEEFFQLHELCNDCEKSAQSKSSITSLHIKCSLLPA